MRFDRRTSCLMGLALLLPGCDWIGLGGDKVTGGDGQHPTWTKSTARQLSDAIDDRATHALDRVRFDVNTKPGTPEGEAALTQAALAYARALARGTADPKKLYDIYAIPRPHPDLERGLASALANDDVRGWLESLAPQSANYRRLSQAYLDLTRQASAPARAIPDAGRQIHVGSADPRVPLIAQQLVAMDYLDPRFARERRYTRAMAAAVRVLQAEYGINPDGIVGSDVLTILNLSDDDRARAIAVAMERLRWLDRSPPPHRIDVNLAAARLSYWRDGNIVDTRKVVVGEPGKETPQLQAPIFRLVANPTWTVPRSVQEQELAGQSDEELQAQNMAWKDGWIVQESGPKNSLGLVKFDMADDQAIYLHDTPAKALFGLVQRQRSHGCVRVEDALGFAAMIAQDQGVEAEWQAALDSGEETMVKLPHQIPVRLLYQTILFSDDGDPVIRNDPYGWNDRLALALGFTASNAMMMKREKGDVGP